MAREGFVLYHEILKWLEPYGDAERGRLLTAMLEYSMSGVSPGLSGNERFIWPAIAAKIDNDIQAYEETCRKNRRNAARRYERTNEEPAESENEPPDASACERMPKLPTETRTETETETETETKSPSEREHAHKRGEFGWVKLTDREYERLQKDLGQAELDRCIAYVDESAQRTGNKNKWKDWNLTIRKCSREQWGIRQNGFAGRNAPHVETPGERTNIDMGKLGRVQNLFG